MTTGICFGSYSPLLRGELDLIMQAKKQCDRCRIIANPEAAERLRRMFAESKEVEVMELEQLSGRPAEDGEAVRWFTQAPFADTVRLLAAAEDEIIIGGEDTSPVADRGDERVEGVLSSRFQGSKVSEGSCRRILITGWASEGKSTLARDIATYFQIPYVPEAARVYMEERHLKDEELTEEDFLQFIRLQNRLTDEANDQFAIVDTDNITTLAYTISYAADPDVTAITDESIRRIREEVRVYDWERVYVLPPKNTYVDDGLRYMKQADLDVRNENFDLLLRLLKEYGLADRITFLTGNYWENFLRVKTDLLEIMAAPSLAATEK